jgi:hypothetical protein
LSNYYYIGLKIHRYIQYTAYVTRRQIIWFNGFINTWTRKIEYKIFLESHTNRAARWPKPSILKIEWISLYSFKSLFDNISLFDLNNMRNPIKAIVIIMYIRQITATMIDNLLKKVLIYHNWIWYMIRRINYDTVNIKMKCAKEKAKKSLI